MRVKGLTFVDAQERADAVTGAVQKVQAGGVERLTGGQVDAGVADVARHHQTRHVDVAHQDAGVGLS